MKRWLLSSLLAAGMMTGASAEVKVTVTPIGELPEKPQQGPLKSVSTAEILVNEDFSNFKEGTESAPDYENNLASMWTTNLIDPALTNGQQWYGNDIYPAGGCVALSTKNMYYPAYLMTPRMDYSGSVKLTFNVKYEYVEFEGEDGTMLHWSGSSCGVYMVTPSQDSFELEGVYNESYDELANVRLYQNQGWYEVEVEFDNYSAYNDASILFQTTEAILLDNIKVTSSVDNFIASPTAVEIFDVKEDSFSVSFDPVRKSFNYYMYLYTLEGYDEAGDPIYFPVPDPVMSAELEEYGMTWEEYLDIMFEGDIFNPYCYYGVVEEFKPTVFTYSGLDPETDYYFGIRSHYVYTFSELEIIPANVIAAPNALEATDITKNSFTANWSPIVKADTYEVILYGTSRVEEDEDSYIVFEEDFSNLAAYSDSDNIYEPTVLDEQSGITIDDLTGVPGWTTNMKKFYITDNGFGIKGYSAQIATPMIYVANSDYITLTIKAKATMDAGGFKLGFGGEIYDVSFEGADFEGELTLPTNGMKEDKLILAGDGQSDLFIEHLVITQSLKEGDYVFYYLGTETVSKDQTSLNFTDLDTDSYSMFSYGVRSVRGEGLSRIESAESSRMVVNLTTGESGTLGVASIIFGANPDEVVEVARYTLDGRLISEPQKGMNIVKYSDGSVKKIMVK